MMKISTLGQAIRDTRKQKGMTIKELGKEIGLSEQAISQYELDKRVPDEATLVKIAVALDTSAMVLLTNAGKNEEEIKSFYDTVIAFTKNMKKETVNNEHSEENPQDYFLEQYIHSLGYEIIRELENGYLILKSKDGEYEIELKDIEELQTSSRSFIEYKLHELINKSRKIGK